jgi:hypothetical protein
MCEQPNELPPAAFCLQPFTGNFSLETIHWQPFTGEHMAKQFRLPPHQHGASLRDMADAFTDRLKAAGQKAQEMASRLLAVEHELRGGT